MSARDTAVTFSRFPWRPLLAAAGLMLLAALAVVGTLHNSIAPHGRGVSLGDIALMPPDRAHPFGTDLAGRDVFSETIHALAMSMGDASIALLLALVLGTLAGLLAAHLMGRTGMALRIALGAVASVPVLLLAALLAVLSGYAFVAIAVGLAAAPAQFVGSFDRTRRLLSAPQADYARASGIAASTLLKRDLAHTFAATLMTTAARAFGALVILIATISFFGFGAEAPARDLGLTIANGHPLDPAWWPAAFPAGALVLVALAVRLVTVPASDERA